MEVPVLETERLKLRGHRISDFAASAAMWADPKVVRHIGGHASTPQQAWLRLMSYVGHWPLLGFGYWAIEEKATGEFVGELGFADFKREMEPSIKGMPEAGWVLRSHAHGKGYGTEALSAIFAWGDKQLPSKRIVCLIEPGNVSSLRLAKKYGFKEVQPTKFNGVPIILFERTGVKQ